MSRILKFRILVDYEEDVFRDIEIKNTSTFEELHVAIQKAFDFDNSQMASFYMSNDNWDKGQEITLMDMAFDEKNPTPTMKETVLEEYIIEKGQKVVYVFDFLLMWCFFVEFVGEVKEDKKVKYPRVSNKFGKSPDQYSKQPAEQTEENELPLKGPVNLSDDDDIFKDDIFEDFDDFDEFGGGESDFGDGGDDYKYN
jgi:hypothetical protein